VRLEAAYFRGDTQAFRARSEGGANSAFQPGPLRDLTPRRICGLHWLIHEQEAGRVMPGARKIRSDCRIEEALRYARGNSPDEALPSADCSSGPIRSLQVQGPPAFHQLTKAPLPPPVAPFDLCPKHQRDPLIRVTKVAPASKNGP
jgi:hypothetical protein